MRDAHPFGHCVSSIYAGVLSVEANNTEPIYLVDVMYASTTCCRSVLCMWHSQYSSDTRMSIRLVQRCLSMRRRAYLCSLPSSRRPPQILKASEFIADLMLREISLWWSNILEHHSYEGSTCGKWNEGYQIITVVAQPMQATSSSHLFQPGGKLSMHTQT